jgi:hypothetical protein
VNEVSSVAKKLPFIKQRKCVEAEQEKLQDIVARQGM